MAIDVSDASDFLKPASRADEACCDDKTALGDATDHSGDIHVTLFGRPLLELTRHLLPRLLQESLLEPIRMLPMQRPSWTRRSVRTFDLQADKCVSSARIASF